MSIIRTKDNVITATVWFSATLRESWERTEEDPAEFEYDIHTYDPDYPSSTNLPVSGPIEVTYVVPLDLDLTDVAITHMRKGIEEANQTAHQITTRLEEKIQSLMALPAPAQED